MPIFDNPALQQFRAAGRLVNEWRDTLSYTVLMACILADSLHHKKIDPELVYIMNFREFVRAAWWYLGKQKLVVGQKTPYNKIRLAAAAAVVSNFFELAQIFFEAANDPSTIGHPRPCLHILVIMFTTPVFLNWSGNLRQIFDSYRDVMWDYPRKKGGGGTTQTQKFKDGVSELFSRYAPRPAMTRAAAYSLAARLSLLPVPKV